MTATQMKPETTDALYLSLPPEVHTAYDATSTLLVGASCLEENLQAGRPHQARDSAHNLDRLSRLLNSAEGPITDVEAVLSANRAVPYAILPQRFPNAHLALLEMASELLWAADPKGQTPYPERNPDASQQYRLALVRHELVTPDFQAPKNYQPYIAYYQRRRPWVDCNPIDAEHRFELAPSASGSPPMRRPRAHSRAESPPWHPSHHDPPPNKIPTAPYRFALREILARTQQATVCHHLQPFPYYSIERFHQC
jgi:hypothetical protein